MSATLKKLKSRTFTHLVIKGTVILNVEQGDNRLKLQMVIVKNELEFPIFGRT